MFGIKKTKQTIQVQQSGSNSVNIQVAGNLSTAPVSLQKKIEASRVSLSKSSLTGTKMAVMAFVDASGSMYSFYDNGTVQELTERALGFAINVDDDGEIPVYGFGSAHFSAGIVNAQNYQGFVSRSPLHAGGSTNLSASLDFLEKAVKKSKEPVYALIVTDGAPNDRNDVAARMKRLSKLPVFIKILVVGFDGGAWSYVKNTLDDNDWDVDNIDGQLINEPSKLSDQQFADKMVEELSEWRRAATDAGIIK